MVGLTLFMPVHLSGDQRISGVLMLYNPLLNFIRQSPCSPSAMGDRDRRGSLEFGVSQPSPKFRPSPVFASLSTGVTGTCATMWLLAT